jgi:adapter protein MecA 1/2
MGFYGILCTYAIHKIFAKTHLREFGDNCRKNTHIGKVEETNEEDSSLNSLRIFAFDSLHELFRPASFVTRFYNGENYLYKEPEQGKYLLVVTRFNDKKESFNRACNILSEYGQLRKGVPHNESFYAEHYELIAGPEALQKFNF